MLGENDDGLDIRRYSGVLEEGSSRTSDVELQHIVHEPIELSGLLWKVVVVHGSRRQREVASHTRLGTMTPSRSRTREGLALCELAGRTLSLHPCSLTIPEVLVFVLIFSSLRINHQRATIALHCTTRTGSSTSWRPRSPSCASSRTHSEVWILQNVRRYRTLLHLSSLELSIQEFFEKMTFPMSRGSHHRTHCSQEDPESIRRSLGVPLTLWNSKSLHAVTSFRHSRTNRSP